MQPDTELYSEEEFGRLILESRETVRRIKTPPDVFRRVKTFNELYSQLPDKPDCAGLLYQAGEGGVSQFQPIGERLVVGRRTKRNGLENGCDLALHDEEISRRHFAIDSAHGFFILRDLQSSNGTYLNDNLARVAEAILKNGDLISAGNKLFVFIGE